MNTEDVKNLRLACLSLLTLGQGKKRYEQENRQIHDKERKNFI